MAAESEPFHGFVGIQGRGVLALPVVLRRRYHLDQPGTQVEITERPDGVLEVRPTVAIPATLWWFWTVVWQARERAVDEAVESGNVTTYAGPDELIAGLDALDADDLPAASDGSHQPR